MVIKNLRIVLSNKIIEKGYLVFDNGVFTDIKEGECPLEALDGKGLTAMPGFIDVHVHGSSGIDFMDAKEDDYEVIANSLYKEGVTTFLATTLTSDHESLLRVCRTVKNIKDYIPSLGGIHFEGPYISTKYKGAQNEKFIRLPDIKEFDELQKASGNNVKYITLAVEKDGALEFIKHVTKQNVVASVGHSDASFNDVKKAIEMGLSNVTHTHNAMSPHHHRHPGVVTSAFYFDELFTEFICDKIHVCPEVLLTSYKIIGPDRFVMITDALKVKNSNINEFQLFGLDCVKKDGAAYLTSGPLAGSILTMDQGLRNMKEITGASLIDLAKISSGNAAKSLHLSDRGELAVNKLADFVLLDESLRVLATYKLGKKVYEND